MTKDIDNHDKLKIMCSYSKLIDVNELKPHPKNPNKHSREQIIRLSELIKYQGIRHPIIVSKLSGHVVVGHGRLEALKLIPGSKAPVEYQDFESEDLEYAFMVSDNAISEWADLDCSMINIELENIDGINFDIEMLGLKNFNLLNENKLSFDGEKETKIKKLNITSCPSCGYEF